MSADLPIRLLIVDDHPVVRGGLRGMFTGDPDFEVVGEAGNGVEAVERAQALRADVVLMDLRMPVMGGVEAIQRLRESAPTVGVLVLTTYDTDDDVLPAIEAGAIGYLLKDAPREELMRAVRQPAQEALSDRELDVLRLIAGGANNREAAAQLFISESTVKTHLLHIYEKLGVRDRAAAVSEAYKRRLLT
jgi:DNA-binding NarL/FixJ family response regulator